MNQTHRHAFFIVAVLVLLAASLLGAPNLAMAQGAVCDQTYTVVSGDWLSNIAQKTLGDSSAYPQIVDATNAANKVDPSYAAIADPNVIEVGQKLCIPKGGSAPAATTAAPAATPAAATGGLTLDQLKNATYQVSDAPGGTVTLKDGKASVEIAPGSATKYEATLGEQTASGDLNGDGVADAADILITSPGGSGTFYYVAAVPNQNGAAGTGVTALLGDRVKVQTLGIANGAINVTYLDRKEGEPMSADPTVPVSKTYVLENGKLVEGASIQPVAAPLEGNYSTTLPAADASGREIILTLGSFDKAVLATQFIGKGAPIVQEGTWSEQNGQATVTLTTQDGQPVTDNFIFEMQNGKLVATQYDTSQWGSQGLTLTPVPASSLASVYRATEPAADAPELIEVLFLGPDGTASQSFNYVGKLTRVDSGTWTQNGTTANVAFTQEDGKPQTTNVSFTLQGNKLVSSNDSLYRLPATEAISGSVTYVEKVGIPDDSVVTVQLLDVSIADQPAVLISETSFRSAGKQVPFPFALGYDPSVIALNHTYSLASNIAVKNTVIFRTTTNYPVLTNGAPTTGIDMTLTKVK